ncbi:HI1506-related protein [Neptunomonas antarctica]|uniref:Rho termination factor, N-terminal domain n=1 Tax=Neptunomonas antarctica TaxID=619304 RepID=A0A1N7MP98_9GAMM|nr:HI1506-related protein [Neptunomonas antarctica]SIS87927.1 Rho termination factor, N-terminal domain [Neptunomonas antarctica]
MSKPTIASHVRITAAIQGFRRAGVAHPAEPTTYPVSEFSETQLAQLQKEPRLVVEFVDAPETDSDDAHQSQEGAVEPDSMEPVLKDMTLPDLKLIAGTGNIAGYASMNKPTLISAIEAARAAQAGA